MRQPVKAALPLVALTILGFLALGQGTARAATLVVDDDGLASVTNCDVLTPTFSTIQGAVTAASAGDTIEVCPGTYIETVTINKQLTVLGAQASVDARTRTAAESDESVVTGGIAGNPAGFSVGANGVQIDGFTFKDVPNVATLGGSAVYLSPSTSGYTVENNIFRSNIFGLYLNSQGTTQTVVRNNFFDDNNDPVGPAGGNGIYSDQGTTNVLVEENRFQDHTNSAIVFDSFAGPNSSITIDDNTTSGDVTLVAMFNTNGATISGNTVTAASQSAIFLGNGASNITIERNSVGSGGTNGVRINDFGAGPVTGVTITNNTIDGRNRGVWVASGSLADDLEAHKNSITGSITDAVRNDDIDTAVDASANWWGSNDPATVAPEMVGTVDFNPLLDSGTDTAPATPGFQPNLSSVTVHTLGTETTSSRIQDGVTYVNASGTVNVLAGAYADGPANVTKTVTLLGAQAGVDARTRSVTEAAESVVTGGMSMAANNVVVDGFLLRDVPNILTLGGGSVYTSPSFSGYVVRNNIFQSNVFGLYLNSEGTTQTVVRHNFFDSNNDPGPNSGTGIYGDQGTHRALVEENRFQGNSLSAMIFDSFTGPNSQITIEDNTTSGDATLAAILDTTNSTISGNTVSGASGSAIFIGHDVNGLTIDGNSVGAGSGRGVNISDAFGTGPVSGVVISDNDITDRTVGVRVANGMLTDELEAHFNRITGSSEFGVKNEDLNATNRVDAEKNWWGDPSGPSLQGPGSGDPVSLNVDFNPWCFNPECTVFGIGGATSGDDEITGTSGDDVIFAGPGDDTVFGGEGDDRLVGENGDDRLVGGAGDDDLEGGSGDDRLEGGSGNDQIDGGDDDDTILGGSGNDTATGGSGADEMRGGSGADELRGNAGRDEIFGGSGNDRLYGGSGADLIDGGDGNDYLNGGSGDDRLKAQDGQTDRVIGGTGTDTGEVDRRDNVSGVERRI